MSDIEYYNPADYLQEADVAVLRDLHERGFAVVGFTPEELDGLENRYVEDVMTERGNDFIEDNKDNRF